MNSNTLKTKIGILCGGQLGRMLCLAGADWNLDIAIMDSKGCPAENLCRTFVDGDINNYNDVLQFGRKVEVLTIEIEHVNIEALEQLEEEGIRVFPKSSTLRIINDKSIQKQFYKDNNIPTSDFQIFQNKQEILNISIERNAEASSVSPFSKMHKSIKFPFVQKSCTGGYDGKGVQVIKNENDLKNLLDGPCIIEQMVDIQKELAVIIARNESGEIKSYPATEMEFDQNSNLVKFLFTPANIDQAIEEKCQKIALDIVEKLDYIGILAVELFLTSNGEILVNEIAPRTHNSGHHTIEGSITSQFQQQLRAILNLPLGDTEFKKYAAMVNLVAEEGYAGKIKVEGLEECLEIPEFYFHLYGKSITKPNRKMGHATILGDNFDEIKQKADTVIKNLKIISE
jgi:5-(carboxyamino)imidazole ribonucleotide synthase